MRKNRIDMNLIYDYDPKIFMKHVDLFVTQLDDPDYLNLFLSGLKDEDITQTMYAYYVKSCSNMSGHDAVK